MGRDVAGRCEAGWDLFREVESDAQWWRSATGEFAPSLRAGDEEEMGELSLLEEFRRRTPWLTHGEDNPDTDPIQRLREKQRKAIAEGLDRRSPARPGGIREDLKPPSQLDNPAVGPVPGERWQTGDSVEVFDAGVFKVYGQLGGGYVTLPSQQLLWSGTTCLGAKVQPLDGAEIQVRGGPRASYREDPVRPDRVFTASPGMLFEVQARYNLLGPVNVEYQWMAMPALDPLERNRLWQDLRFAIPVGARGHFRVGARHEWETFNEVPARGARARPLADSTELYLGFGLRR